MSNTARKITFGIIGFVVGYLLTTLLLQAIGFGAIPSKSGRGAPTGKPACICPGQNTEPGRGRNPHRNPQPSCSCPSTAPSSSPDRGGSRK